MCIAGWGLHSLKRKKKSQSVYLRTESPLPPEASLSFCFLSAWMQTGARGAPQLSQWLLDSDRPACTHPDITIFLLADLRPVASIWGSQSCPIFEMIVLASLVRLLKGFDELIGARHKGLPSPRKCSVSNGYH